MLTVSICACMIYSILGIACSILDNGRHAAETCWSLSVPGVLWRSHMIHPTEPVANHPNRAVVSHPTDCKPEIAPRVFYMVAVGWSRWLIQLCVGENSGSPGGCFTNALRAVQYNLVKINNTRAHLYGQNFKLKLCTCARSVALHIHKSFNLEIIIRNTIPAIQKFPENILDSSTNLSKTTPLHHNTTDFWLMGTVLIGFWGSCINFSYHLLYSQEHVGTCTIPCWPRSVSKSDVERSWNPNLKWPDDLEGQGQWPLYSIPVKRISRCIFVANLVILVQIHYKLLRRQTQFPMVLSPIGQNDIKGQDQRPLLSIPAEKVSWCMLGENLTIPAQICDNSSCEQSELPSIVRQSGQNDLEGQCQWPLFSIPTESIPGCTFGANLVILAQICDELSCGQGTEGQTEDRHRQRKYLFGPKAKN